MAIFIEQTLFRTMPVTTAQHPATEFLMPGGNADIRNADGDRPARCAIEKNLISPDLKKPGAVLLFNPVDGSCFCRGPGDFRPRL
jgi:hypothetical protein